MSELQELESSPTADVSVMHIARIYAESLLDAAAKKGETDAVLEELDSLIDDLFKAQPQFETLLSSAVVGQHIRHDVLEKTFSGRASETFLSFLQVLNRHERLELIRPIRVAAHEIDNERRGRLRVVVHSAVPLPDDIRAALSERIRQRYQKEPILETHLDPDLIGGMKVRIQDDQVDATVSNQVDKIKNYMLERSSHEIQSGRNRLSSAE